MQSVSTQFANYAKSSIRPMSFRVEFAFERQFDENATFFTIGTSEIAGIDPIKGESDVLFEWGKYRYTDFTRRLIGFEWSHQEDQKFGISTSFANIVLDNHDDYFTPKRGSDIEQYLKPQRPVRIYGGFGTELLQVFVGITKGRIKIDENAKTATFKAEGFLDTLLSRQLENTSLFQDKRTDEILQTLFTNNGLGVGQYSLDTGFNIPSFVYAEAGLTLGGIVEKLLQAEFGRLYMDENGLIVFKNRQNYNTNIQDEFSHNNVIDFDTRDDEIINVVEIKAAIRDVVGTEQLQTQQEVQLIRAGETIDVWRTFADPVVAVNTPQDYLGATSSYWVANTAADNSGTYNNSDITLNSTSLFSTSYLMTFENTGTTDLYITTIMLYGNPARAVENVFIREEDATSVAEFDENKISIENDFFQDRTTVESRAKIFLRDHKDYYDNLELDVVGNWAYQLGDAVRLNIDGQTQDFVIIGINGVFDDGGLQQRLKLRQFERVSYFTIGQSLIGGTDEIAP